MKRFVALITVVGLIAAACTSGAGEGTETGNNSDPVDSPESTASQWRSVVRGDVWATDFSQSSVSLLDVTRGQVKDGIPAIDDPSFIGVAEANFLGELEPVISLELNGEARAYPLQILTWHEIVNDTIGGQPVAVTFCPLCNTALAFAAEVDGLVLDFGVSGFLRNSDLIMYDRQTETWWQQVTGEGIVGSLTGTNLTPLPVQIVAWSDFRDNFPDGLVLSQITGFNRPYGNNPYPGYDDINSSPFLFDGETDGRLAVKERVVTVELGNEVVAYPFSTLAESGVIHDQVGGTDVVVFHASGTASALDGSNIANSRDVGATGVFSPVADGRQLSFSRQDDSFVDQETGSSWNIFGEATSGELAGSRLAPIVSGNHFWFAWAAFQPETRLFIGSAVLNQSPVETP